MVVRQLIPAVVVMAVVVAVLATTVAEVARSATTLPVVAAAVDPLMSPQTPQQLPNHSQTTAAP
jgi:ABC-type uncharacterized transport system substrate-binding protein